MSYTVAVIINKDDNRLGASETFLRAHIKDLPCDAIPLIGNPGYRCLDANKELYVPSRSTLSLGFRWLGRQIGVTTLSAQDRRALSRFLRRKGVNAVLAEYGQTAVSVMDACRDASVPLIAHFHGWDAYSEFEIKQNAEGYRRLFKQAAAIIAVSKHMRNQLLTLGANPEKTYHNSCGAEIPAGLIATPSQVNKRFLMVGRLTEKKAPFVSIMAFAKVAILHPDVRLDIIGSGHLKDACIQLCESLSLNDRVVFHGEQSHKVVLAFMAKARCFIQHSVRAPGGDHEGTPVGVLEAMGMGLPVVATRHGGIMDVVESGETGVLVDEYDVDGMVQAMIMYAENSLLAQQNGKNGRAKVMANLTSDKSVGRLWKIVEQSIQNSFDAAK